MRRSTGMLLVAALLAGPLACSTTPDEATVASADIGPYPDDYDALIRSHLRQLIPDPEAYRDVVVEPPARGFYDLGFGSRVFGWRSLVTLHPKRRVSGYGDAVTYVAVIRHGEVVVLRRGP